MAAHTHTPDLRRTQVREILKRHKGSISAIARDLGVTAVTVSQCLRGKSTSARIMDAARDRANEFLAEESEVVSAETRITQ